MKIIEFTRKSKLEPKEIYSLINVKSSWINIYQCLFMGNVKYRLRNNKNDNLIAEFDKDLNMIGNLKTCIDKKEFDKVMELLIEEKTNNDTASEKFGFNRLEIINNEI